MNSLPDIRPWFRPVQPTVPDMPDNVSYVEFSPDSRLSSFIYCYWQLKTHQPLVEPFYYRVVADGCLDWFVDLTVLDTVYIMGFSTSYIEFPLHPGFHYVGVRFLPAAFPLLFRSNALELTNRLEDLKLLLPRVADQLLTLLQPTVLFHDLKQKLDVYFLNYLSGVSIVLDPRLCAAIDMILKTQGRLTIERDLDTGLSTRQLRRLFDFYIGDSPKMFSKVVRFQNFLQARPSAETLRKDKLFFDAGYYDQAHFIKEFKTMYGLTPSVAFQ